MQAATKYGQLETVSMIIEEVGGLDKIEQLQTHENEEIYSSALRIIETFFAPDDQAEDSVIAASVTSTANGDSMYQFSTSNTPDSGFFF